MTCTGFWIGDIKVLNDEFAEADDSRLNGALSPSAARRRTRTVRALAGDLCGQRTDQGRA
jgi:hypothetical protein